MLRASSSEEGTGSNIDITQLTSNWQPTASLAQIKARAELLAKVRGFFSQRSLIEVETPLLSSATGTDPHLNPFEVSVNQQQMFLQTSPEFSMKRLLASGSGPIFQICKAFREGEAGKKHNPEFTMLEWYQPGMALFELMTEVEALVKVLLPTQCREFQSISYRSLFQDKFEIDPHHVRLDEIKGIVLREIELSVESNDVDFWLDLAFSHLIEPTLLSPTFIYHYPKTQAALARIEKDEQGTEVAQRFELVINGMELANGYFELCDPEEQLKRFNTEQKMRRNAGLDIHPMDEKFLAALVHGLPACSGVAMGLDRLLMLLTDKDAIAEVIAFTTERA